MNWHGKKILVIGLGDTGLSVARWGARAGVDLRLADTRPTPAGLAQVAREFPGVPIHCGPLTSAVFGDAELAVASPGLALGGPAGDPALARAQAAGLEVIGDVELFARIVSGRAAAEGRQLTMLGITGTNGKSTVTALTGALLAAAGWETVVAGNIGPPVLDALAAYEHRTLPDAFVLELSSFQLETISSLELAAAAMLNLTQDHLDRHGNMRDYAQAKQRIFQHARVQVLNRDDPASLAMGDCARDTRTFGLDTPRHDHEYGLSATHFLEGSTELAPRSVFEPAGAHNTANALAALALARAVIREFLKN